MLLTHNIPLFIVQVQTGSTSLLYVSVFSFLLLPIEETRFSSTGPVCRHICSITSNVSCCSGFYEMVFCDWHANCHTACILGSLIIQICSFRWLDHTCSLLLGSIPHISQSEFLFQFATVTQGHFEELHCHDHEPRKDCRRVGSRTPQRWRNHHQVRPKRRSSRCQLQAATLTFHPPDVHGMF